MKSKRLSIYYLFSLVLICCIIYSTLSKSDNYEPSNQRRLQFEGMYETNGFIVRKGKQLLEPKVSKKKKMSASQHRASTLKKQVLNIYVYIIL